VAARIGSRIDDLKASLGRLAPRERLMLGGLAAVVGLGLVLGVGLFIQSGLDEIEEHNEAMRLALRDLERNKEAYLVQRQRTAILERRIPQTPIELNRLVETAASSVGVSIAESGESTPIAGERFVQRAVDIKLRKVNIEQLAKLIKALENSPHIVQVTRLSVNTRWNQHQDLDVEMTVSTYERKQRGGGGTPAPGGARERGRS
jgi:type II secretory pathway component PulM